MRKDTTRHRRTKCADRCPATGKRRFRDAREATRALQGLQNLAHSQDEAGVEHRIHVKRKYRCEACKGWHLTSWDTPNGPLPEPRSAADPLVASLAAV